MARAQDLAGLAALGALAYHLRPGKNLQTETQNTGADPDAAMGSPSISALNAREFGDPVDQTERMADIGPSGSRAKVNDETGQLYYPEGAPAPARAPTRAPARPVARAPAMGGSANTRSGAGFGEAAAYRQQQYEDAQRQAATPEAKAQRAQQIEGQAAENMTGDFIPMGRAIKAAGSAGRTLAKFAGPKEIGMAERKALEMSRAQEPARALANNPTRQISGPSKADLVARDRATRAVAREKGMLEENAARYNLDPSDPGFAAQAANMRGSLGGKDWTLKKKGGKVKTKKMASGGLSSASKRGDGIATRGKTKCKMY